MHHAHDDYQTNEILTAPPAKLHLLLLAGAARKTRQAIQWLEQDQDSEHATDAVIVALQIMGELMASLKPAHHPQLARQVAGEYVFIVRSLSEGNLRRDATMLQDALRIIEFQLETWRQLNEQLQQQGEGAPPQPNQGLPGAALESPPEKHPPISPPKVLKGSTASHSSIGAHHSDEPSISAGLDLDV